MSNELIYTIGYGSRTMIAFVDLLIAANIDYLIDVRSKPFSSFKPDFSRANLEAELDRHSIRYVHMGDALGGLPKNPAVYTQDGKVDYSKVGEKEFYISGIERLTNALSQSFSVAIMCSEEKPERCHRSKLIGETLAGLGIEVIHIDEQGELLTQSEVMLRLTSGQMTMFDEVDPRTSSRKSYKPELDDDA